MRTCSHCKEEKNLSEFYKDKTKPDGYRLQCKVCTRKKKKKKCTSCKATKKIEEFYDNSSRCISCEKERSKKRSKGSQVITMDDIDQMEGACIALRSKTAGMKVCPSCELDLKIDHFSPDSKNLDGLSEKCSTCISLNGVTNKTTIKLKRNKQFLILFLADRMEEASQKDKAS